MRVVGLINLLTKKLRKSLRDAIKISLVQEVPSNQKNVLSKLLKCHKKTKRDIKLDMKARRFEPLHVMFCSIPNLTIAQAA